MDLTSNHPFWFVRNGLIQSYPPIERSESCDVAIVGAGITGALIAHRLAQSGFAVIVVDKRDVCLGSTAANTGLWQYEIDVPLVELAKKIESASAVQAYRLSYESVNLLATFADEIPTDCGFERKTSLYVAFDKKKAALLTEEAAARSACGIDVRMIGAEELRDEFHLRGHGALVSDRAASCDPYRFTHGLLASAARSGARIFDRTEVTRFKCLSDCVRLRTKRGFTITARNVVVATGYEAQSMLKERVADMKSTYALVSAPLESIAPWDHRWIMWEVNNPYLYMRATSDNRLLIGGEDDPFHNPNRRDANLPKKTRRLTSKVSKMLPDLDFDVEFAWAGTFGETVDGLAYIGATPEYPRCYFALGFGGNGTTFSALAADIIADLLSGKQRDDAALFRFGR